MILPTRRPLLLAALCALFSPRLALPQGAVAQTEPTALQAPAGVTAIAGRVVDLNGNGLADVLVSVQTETVRTDRWGRYILGAVPVGASVLRIDARYTGSRHQTNYGIYEVRVEARSGKTTILPYKHWLPLIDHEHDMEVASPTAAAVVVTNPAIVDLELHIPAGTVITGLDGKPVTRIGITRLPPDKAPFPLRSGMRIPIMFTLQPGAACLYTATGTKAYAELWYPNVTHELPKARATFWRYEPDGNGWTSRGTGTVSSDGRYIVPDAGAEISDFGSAECDPRTRSKMEPPQVVRVRRQQP